MECAKRINQTIGRGIRNKDDFCSVVIIDSRLKFSTDLQKYLSKWYQ